MSSVLNNNTVCLICNGSCSSTRNSIPIFSEETTTCSEKPFIRILSKVLDKEVTEESIHSKLICKKCFKSFDELDELELRCNKIKNDILRVYNISLQKHIETQNEDKKNSIKISQQTVKENSFLKVSRKNLIPILSIEDTKTLSTDTYPTIQVLEDELFDIKDMNRGNNKDVIDKNLEFDYNDLAVNKSIVKLENNQRKRKEEKQQKYEIDNEKPNILKKKLISEDTEDVKSIEESLVSKDGDNYTCLLCNDDHISGEPKTIIAHMKDVHDVRLYICDVCGLDFKKRNELSAHLDKHVAMDEGDFQCEICNRIFCNLRLFRIHKRMHAPQNKAWPCPQCGKKYSSRNLLEEHINMHTGVRPYICKVCGKDFASKYTFKAHEKTHEIRPRPFLCQQCPKSFLSQQNLSQHERTHLGVKEHSCDLCGKQFGSAHNLEVHSIVHTGYKPFPCDLCGKSFARKAEIRDHERTHTGERPYQCEFCGSTFSQRSNLQSHKRATHYDDKRYKCDQCGKAFKRRRLLDYHLKAAHTGERPFKCNVCDATFVYPEHFKKHRRIHTGEKPFICEVCGKAFNSRDNRNAHRFVHSDKKLYECLCCGAGFMRKPLLYQHMQAMGHLNDTIVVNQPRVTTDDDELVTVNSQGEMEIIDSNINPNDSKLYIAEHILNEEELTEGGHAIEHIIIDGQQITFTEEGEYEEVISGSVLTDGDTQIIQTEDGPMQLVKVRIPDDIGGEQEAWVKIVPE